MEHGQWLKVLISKHWSARNKEHLEISRECQMFMKGRIQPSKHLLSKWEKEANKVSKQNTIGTLTCQQMLKELLLQTSYSAVNGIWELSVSMSVKHLTANCIFLCQIHFQRDRSLIKLPTLSVGVGLFQAFNFGNLYFPKKLCISLRLSNLLA